MIIFEHLNKFLPLFEECEKHNSIVQFYEKIKVNNIICLFYEKGERLQNPIDEKKLLEMFIKLNEINLAGSRDLPGSKILIYYYDNDIILKDGKYQIRPSSIYEKQKDREEYLLAENILRIFRKFNLNLTEKIKEITLNIRI